MALLSARGRRAYCFCRCIRYYAWVERTMVPTRMQIEKVINYNHILHLRIQTLRFYLFLFQKGLLLKARDCEVRGAIETHFRLEPQY